MLEPEANRKYGLTLYVTRWASWLRTWCLCPCAIKEVLVSVVETALRQTCYAIHHWSQLVIASLGFPHHLQGFMAYNEGATGTAWSARSRTVQTDAVSSCPSF